MLKNSNPDQLMTQLTCTGNLLNRLRLMFNVEKSCLIPTSTFEYLDAIIYLDKGLIFPSEERFQIIVQLVQLIQKSAQVEA